jgi:predicted ATPase
MNNALTLKQFDMKQINDNKICVFIGKCNTGKSYCIRDLCYHKSDIPEVNIQTTDTEYFKSFAPKSMIINGFSSLISHSFLQKQIYKSYNKSDNNDPRGIFILEDFSYQDNRWYSIDEDYETRKVNKIFSVCIT